MLTLDEFFKKLDSYEIHPSTMIVRLRYKYSFETEFIEENEVLLYECDRNGAPVFVWENDWDEGQTSNGEVYVMGWIDVDDVKVPGYEDYEPSVLADGTTEPERIFMADGVSIVSFERSEWTKLRDSRWLMGHFDLVMEIKRTGLFVVGDLIPTSINGYSVERAFEVTPPEFVYEGCVDVHFCIMLSDVSGGPISFDKRMIFDLNGRECDDFFKEHIGTRIRETFEQLLLQVCRRTNEMKADEIRGLADRWTYS